MNTITDYWQIIIAVICLVCCAIESAMFFYYEPKEKKIKCVKEALLYFVVLAEKELGEKTGQLKLRYVWNMAVNQFKWLPRLIDFDTFSKWVDEALIWMKQQLESNKSIQDYIEGQNNESN